MTMMTGRMTMWVSDGWKDYELLDCGGGERLERWGKFTLVASVS